MLDAQATTRCAVLQIPRRYFEENYYKILMGLVAGYQLSSFRLHREV